MKTSIAASFVSIPPRKFPAMASVLIETDSITETRKKEKITVIHGGPGKYAEFLGLLAMFFWGGGGWGGDCHMLL